MSTYIVEIDSSYRNIDFYQKQTDFAVSFQTNTSADYFANGLPLNTSSITGSETVNYFTQTSIDPDYQQTNLSIVGGILQDIQRNGTTYYLSGITVATGSTGFSIQYVSTSLANFAVMPSLPSPFLAKLTQQVDASFQFNWISYLYGSFNNTTGPLGTGAIDNSIYYTSFSKCKMGSNDSVYWMFNSNYFTMNLSVYSTGSTGSSLYTINNPSIYANSLNEYIVALSSNGYYHFVENRPWGYHALHSNWNLINTNDNGTTTLLLDESENVYVSTNIGDTFYPHFAVGQLFSNINRDTQPQSNFICSLTGITGASGPNQSQKYFLASVGFTTSQATTSFIEIFKTGLNLYDFFTYGYINLASINPVNANGVFSEFCKVNNKIYCIISMRSNNDLLNDTYPLFILLLDLYNITYTLLATTASVFTRAKIGTVVIGSSFFITARSCNSENKIYTYEFNTSTNILTTRASINTSTTTSTINSTVCQCIIDPINSNQLLIVSPTITNNLETSLLTYIFDLTTYTLIYNGSISCYTIWNSSSCFIIKNKPYFLIGTEYPNVCQIFDISNITSPTLSSTIYTNSGQVIIVPYEYIDEVLLSPNYFLSISGQYSNGSLIYNINDPINPYSIQPRTISNKLLDTNKYTNYLTAGPSTFSVFDPETGFIYGSKDRIGISGQNNREAQDGFYKVQSNVLPIDLYSTHYYQNLNVTQALSPSATGSVISIVSYPTQAFIFVASTTQIYIYKTVNVIQLELYSTLTLQSSLGSSPVDLTTLSITQTDGSVVIYLSVASTSLTQLYVSDTTFLNWTFISSILPATTLPSNRTFRRIGIVNIPTAQTPGLYLLTFDLNMTVRKYRINIASNTITLLLTSTPFATDKPSYLTKDISFYYYIRTNTYVCFLSGGFADNSAVDALSFTITEPTNFLPNWTVVNRYVRTTPTFIVQNTYENNVLFVSIPRTTEPTEQRANGYVNSFDVRPSTDFNLSGGDLNSHFANTSWIDPLTKRTYVAWNYGDNTVTPYDKLNIADFTNTADPVMVAQNTITFNGEVLQMDHYSLGNRTVLVSLLNNNTLYLYDVSNPSFANSYQSQQQLTTTYNNLQANGTAIVHKVLNNGSPDWLNVVGSLQDDTMGSNGNISGMTIDQFNNLYVSGSWIRRLNLFQTYSGTGSSTTVQSYPTNEFINNSESVQGFLAKLRTDTGKWVWCEPYIGNIDILTRDLGYSSVANKLVCISSFTSQTQNFYLPQTSIYSTGTSSYTDVGLPQLISSNISNSTSIILSIDRNGLITWNAVLNSEVPQTDINLYNLFIDEFDPTDVRLVVSGISNTTNLIGTDGQGNPIQSLYTTIDSITQQYNMIYSFSLEQGAYQSSQYISRPADTLLFNYGIRSYSDINQILSINSAYSSSSGKQLQVYNKDSTLAGTVLLPVFISTSLVSVYDHNSIYQDPNTFSYSQLYLYNFTGSLSVLTENFTNYSVFVLGSLEDTILNRNFLTRDTSYNTFTNTLVITLNKVIPTNKLVRDFSIVNDITGSSNYYASNLSTSNLTNIVTYNNTSQTGNSIVLTKLYNENALSSSTQYYFVFPQTNTGSIGSYTQIVPVTSVAYNSSLKQYTLTVDDISQLRIPSPSGPLYGPYIYLAQKNYSAFYSLQWYPGSRTYNQTYLVGLYDLIIPNRPIRKSEYPGRRFVTDFPYIYLVIYNADKNDEFNPSVVNSVYDNNVNAPRFALFQIPTTSFSSFSSDGNYLSATSSATPKIIFTPGYYYLHFKLTDPNGNVILFDNTPFKDADSIFVDGVVPETLLNVTVRMAFKKS